MDHFQSLDLIVLAALAVVIALFVLGLRGILRNGPGESTRESWLRWRGCSRKRAYSTRKEAQVVVARHRREGDVVEAYQCRWCQRWHVGHSWPLRRG